MTEEEYLNNETGVRRLDKSYYKVSLVDEKDNIIQQSIPMRGLAFLRYVLFKFDDMRKGYRLIILQISEQEKEQ